MKSLQKVQIIVFRRCPKLEFLLLRTNRGKPIWQGITGGVETFDLSLRSAAVRELKEELHIQTTEDKIIGPLHEFEFVTERTGYKGTVAKEYCFAFEISGQYTVVLSKEHSEYKWLPFEEALELVDYENPKILIRNVKELFLHEF